WIKLPYLRIPGFQDIKRDDIVVFNYPMEDFRPVDKRENYIKRCIAIPGDTITIHDRQLHINGIAAENPEKMQFGYYIKTDGSSINPIILASLDITKSEGGAVAANGVYRYNMTHEAAEKIKALKNVLAIEPSNISAGSEATRYAERLY